MDSLKTIDSSIKIRSGLQDVWGFLFVPENAKRWVTDLESNDKLTPGEITIGSRFLKKYKNGISFEEAVTELVPSKKVVTIIKQPGFSLTLTATFSTDEMDIGWTTYSINTEFRFADEMAGFFSEEYMNAISGKLKMDLEHLKVLLERF